METRPYSLALILIGYTFFDLSSGDSTGDNNNFDIWVKNTFGIHISTSLKFKIYNFIIHIHHWLILIGLYLFFYSVDYNLCSLLCIGGIIQGIVCYDDWFRVVYVI